MSNDSEPGSVEGAEVREESSPSIVLHNLLPIFLSGIIYLQEKAFAPSHN
jgi:hypothetical protein